MPRTTSPDYIIDPSQAASGNRYQSFATLFPSGNGRCNITALGRPTYVRIDSNLTERWDSSVLTTNSTNKLIIYPNTKGRTWSEPSETYGFALHCRTKNIEVEDIDFVGNNGYGNSTIYFQGAVNKLIRCILRGGFVGITAETGGEVLNTLIWGNAIGVYSENYCNLKLINVTAVKNTTSGITCNSAHSGIAATVINVVAYGNGTNWDAFTNSDCAAAWNNAGASGDTVPDTVGSTNLTTIVSGDFVDYSGNDFHITSTSRLRHTHASFPSGDNSRSETTQDFDEQTLPTYSGSSDRWDIGFDYYVLVVVGTRYYRATDLSVAANASAVYRASDNAAYTLNDLIAEDTLEIRSGAVVHFKDNGSAVYNYLKGIKFDIVNGELWFENALTTLGMTLFGIKGGAITVGAQGKFYGRGTLIQLADLSLSAYASNRALDQNEWDNMWTTGSKDATSGGRYGEPSVLFIGANAGVAVPWYNKGSGSTIGDVQNDTTHGRFFTFAPATGIIDFPDQVPTTSEKVYCWNLMLHSQNGQGTPAQSYGSMLLRAARSTWSASISPATQPFKTATLCAWLG
jgi:hypothetical protein